MSRELPISIGKFTARAPRIVDVGDRENVAAGPKRRV